MGQRALIAAIAATHLAFLAYVVFGGFLTWRWPRAIWPHLAVVTWAVLIVAHRVDCPLTWAEDHARHWAGEPPLRGGFVASYLDNVIYPGRYVTAVRVACALVVAASWLVGYCRWRARRRVGVPA